MSRSAAPAAWMRRLLRMAPVPGTFSYTPGAGTVLNAGAGQTLHVHFAPTDTLSYSEASRDVAINVSQAHLAVVADNVSKTYGQADPALTYRIVSGSLADGDAFIGSLAREAGEDVGTYDIGPGTLALSGNYHLTFAGTGDGDPGGPCGAATATPATWTCSSSTAGPSSCAGFRGRPSSGRRCTSRTPGTAWAGRR